MKFQRTRIVISTLFAILGALFAAFWIRSKSTNDTVFKLDANYYLTTLGSDAGTLYFSRNLVALGAALRVAPHGWKHESSSANNRTKKFAWIRGAGNTFISAPHWFIITACAVAAAIPWAHLKFSLRTLLIILTIASCALGLGAWVIKNH